MCVSRCCGTCDHADRASTDWVWCREIERDQRRSDVCLWWRLDRHTIADAIEDREIAHGQF